MGKLRSREGCLTCRSRRVKCDEARPVCGNCQKSNRDCRLELRREAQIRFHRRRDVSPSKTPEGIRTATSNSSSPPTSVHHGSVQGGSVQLLQPGSASPDFHVPSPWPGPASPQNLIAKALTRHEASLVHYYSIHLGKWLDCTDASRQFTLKIPALATTSPVLLEAIMSFAARHKGDAEAASLAHERSIAMLIVLLDSEQVADDDVLLCAIVILRVFEQLTALRNGSDQERHLAGCSALLRACQGPCVDPAAPGLRDAAFWVYMRQCLYNACINQQAPNVDFSLTLSPIPTPGNADSLRFETAWANTMTWICATIVQFCFGSHAQEPSNRMAKWQELSNTLEDWARSRPSSFNPIWQSNETCHENPFPEYYFAADWHVVAFGFYQLACMLLIIYKPNPRFAIRSVHAGRLRKEDAQILEHARAFVFLWGGLLDDPCERNCLVQLLEELEHNHAWPTAWIISLLREEWGTIAV
ncbi:putative C6 transcription factor [Coniochaeta hoffmannii]|uniref:C6 transcription factor n=1 Tax=Coniochaeta hoffmannii TaxID=91930 RepID=A0AA38RKS1_9PEZI|nr:putative C6 transcription factor [Coniochaeta hoffmannii]